MPQLRELNDYLSGKDLFNSLGSLVACLSCAEYKSIYINISPFGFEGRILDLIIFVIVLL